MFENMVRSSHLSRENISTTKINDYDKTSNNKTFNPKWLIGNCFQKTITYGMMKCFFVKFGDNNTILKSPAV